jgi:hypothetical protein
LIEPLIWETVKMIAPEDDEDKRSMRENEIKNGLAMDMTDAIE